MDPTRPDFRPRLNSMVAQHTTAEENDAMVQQLLEMHRQRASQANVIQKSKACFEKLVEYILRRLEHELHFVHQINRPVAFTELLNALQNEPDFKLDDHSFVNIPQNLMGPISWDFHGSQPARHYFPNRSFPEDLQAQDNLGGGYTGGLPGFAPPRPPTRTYTPPQQGIIDWRTDPRRLIPLPPWFVPPPGSVIIDMTKPPRGQGPPAGTPRGPREMMEGHRGKGQGQMTGVRGGGRGQRNGCGARGRGGGRGGGRGNRGGNWT